MHSTCIFLIHVSDFAMLHKYFCNSKEISIHLRTYSLQGSLHPSRLVCLVASRLNNLLAIHPASLLGSQVLSHPYNRQISPLGNHHRNRRCNLLLNLQRNQAGSPHRGPLPSLPVIPQISQATSPLRLLHANPHSNLLANHLSNRHHNHQHNHHVNHMYNQVVNP